jgi:hypothetical protein
MRITPLPSQARLALAPRLWPAPLTRIGLAERSIAPRRRSLSHRRHPPRMAGV